MHTPELTITSEILRNIATIEYAKAVIENKTILPHWVKQLQKEAKIEFIENSLGMDEFSFEKDLIKEYIDGLEKRVAKEIKHIDKAVEVVDEISQTKELDEDKIRRLQETLTNGKSMYRNKKVVGCLNPEEILAEIVSLFDWYNSLEAKETHPIIVAGILHAQLEFIRPFEQLNSATINLTTKASLKISGYGFDDYISYEKQFNTGKRAYEKALDGIDGSDGDLTTWLEFYTDIIARETSNVKEQVMLLARDTKIAKASGRVDLTQRQERIVEFLQDYGLIRNKDFTRIFPDVSEDSVLRDLKSLINKEIVVKKGKTKSSRYELR